MTWLLRHLSLIGSMKSIYRSAITSQIIFRLSKSHDHARRPPKTDFLLIPGIPMPYHPLIPGILAWSIPRVNLDWKVTSTRDMSPLTSIRRSNPRERPPRNKRRAPRRKSSTLRSFHWNWTYTGILSNFAYWLFVLKELKFWNKNEGSPCLFKSNSTLFILNKSL